MTRKLTVVAALAATLSLAACGSDDDAPEAQASKASASASAYQPVSDVDAHAAIGADAAEIRTLLEPAAEGGKADFAAAAKIWSEGGNSLHGDGTPRTLAELVEESPVGERVADALAGSGSAADLDAAQRRQWIDKGITVALARKTVGELESAAEKVDAGDIDPDEGAPHNVDEAWAFFTAEGEGPAATAEKRAEDYGLAADGLTAPILAALADAQSAALDGDADALATATERVEAGLNRVFALAVKKYAVEGIDDPVSRQEGLAFSWGLGDRPPADLAAALEAAFGPGASQQTAADLSTALEDARGELNVEEALPDYTG
ncbi:MAG: hypothetical protein WEB79_07955 [Thermoleophilaceae bacterium]